MLMSIECDCGKLKGTVDTKHLKGYRAACLCDDCQAYAHYIKRADILDKNAGTDIIPVVPGNYQFTEGKENLTCVRLNDKGMFRWYTKCCHTPVGNTMASPSMAYIGLPSYIFFKKYSAAQIENEFGPIREYIQAQFGIGELPKNSSKKVSPMFMARVIRFMLSAKFRKAEHPSPFFDSEGKPLSKPYVLTQEEREALRPLCGTKREV